MTAYIYDNTFAGLLSAVFDAYTGKRFPERLYAREQALPLLAGASHTVETREDKADRVLAGLAKRLSAQGLRDCLLAFLAEEPGGDTRLFRYIRKVFDSRVPVEGMLADEDVFAVAALAQKVRTEQNRLLGFVRFQKTAGSLYFAAIQPRHNVLPLLLDHFSGRFGDQSWIIYDVARSYGALCEHGQCRDVFLDEALVSRLALSGGRLDASLLAGEEKEVQRLWQAYFSATSIGERANPRLQKRCLPVRYWAYLTEKQGGGQGLP